MQLARDGAGSRPLAVTIAGWALIADAAISMLFIASGLFFTEIPIALRVVSFVIFAAIAFLEWWIGRSVLRRRRWFLGVAFPAIFLGLGFLIPPLEDAPALPLPGMIYSIVATILWAFVVVALVWHRPWFTESGEPIAARLGRRPGE